MANRDVWKYLRHSDETDLNAYAGITATFNSEWTIIGGDWIGLAVKNLNASGSSMTLIPSIQVTPDDGTTIFDFPADKNSQTKATFADMGADDDTAMAQEFYLQPYPASPGPGNFVWKFRVNFTYGGTEGTNTVTAWWWYRNTAGEQG